jgi:hypothetical protein
MFPDPALTLADQIFRIVDVFLRTLAPEAHKCRVGLVSCAIWNRVRRLERRFLTLYAMWKAGTLPKPRTSPSPLKGEGRGGGGATAPAAAHPSPRPGDINVRPASMLPRGFGWLRRMLPLSAGTLASLLGPLVREHPEMKEFVAGCPQVGRVLRPMCGMVAIRPPEWLALPKRARARRAAAAHQLSAEDEALLLRMTTPFPDTPAARSARRALRRSMATGQPVDPRKLSAEAFGYVLHWPRDDNCPPPRIGYGGRAFPPLPKDYERPHDEDWPG